MISGLDLLHLLDALYLLALACWVGGQLLFVAVVAPVVFRVLPAEAAAKFVRALFPRYFAWGAISAAVGLPCLVCGPLAVPELRGPAVGAQAGLVVVAILLNLYCANALTPRINAAWDAGEPARGRFETLHRRSVRVNGLVLLIGLVLLFWHAFRLAPQSRGIEEPTFQERAERAGKSASRAPMLRAEWHQSGQLS
jgi:uncharacterized membrane protein